MPGRLLPGAMCVQRFDDSLNSAIHITYRISLRSSSMPEPRDPLLKVLSCFFVFQSELVIRYKIQEFGAAGGGSIVSPPRGEGAPTAPPRQQNIGKVHNGFGVVTL